MKLIKTINRNPRDFAINTREILKGKFDKAPFFSQELAAEIALASLEEPELFARLISKNVLAGTHATDFITYVIGMSGTGKTGVVFRLVLEHYLKANKSVNV